MQTSNCNEWRSAQGKGCGIIDWKLVRNHSFHRHFDSDSLSWWLHICDNDGRSFHRSLGVEDFMIFCRRIFLTKHLINAICTSYMNFCNQPNFFHHNDFYLPSRHPNLCHHNHSANINLYHSCPFHAFFNNYFLAICIPNSITMMITVRAHTVCLVQYLHRQN